MPEVTSYIVKKPELWFEAVGKTAPDGVLGLPEQVTVVYRSVLATPGDRFHVVDGTLVHEDMNGNFRVGSLSLGPAANNRRDAVRLVVAGAATPEPDRLGPPVTVPAVPDVEYPSHHFGIERQAVSPAFVAMLDGTESLRHECYEESEWRVICSDYELDRAVAFSIVDAEVGLMLLNIEHDPVVGRATISVLPSEHSEMISRALASEAISMEGHDKITICGWTAGHWSAVQSALSHALLDRHPSRQMPMAMAV